MQPASLTKLKETMLELIDLGNNAEGGDDSLGIYSYCDTAGPGAGQGGFLWYDEKDKFLDMVRHLCGFWNEFEWENDLYYFAAAAVVVDRMIREELDWETARIEMNKAIKGSLVHISWWGTFKDLLTGDQEFANDFRDSFWSDQGKESPCYDPIPEDLMPQFWEFYNSYM